MTYFLIEQKCGGVKPTHAGVVVAVGGLQLVSGKWDGFPIVKKPRRHRTLNESGVPHDRRREAVAQICSWLMPCFLTLHIY